MTTTQSTNDDHDGNNRSEVAIIIALIEAEHIAGRRAQHDFAMTAKHSFIAKREENIGQHYMALASMMPSEQAMGLVIDALTRADGGNNATS